MKFQDVRTYFSNSSICLLFFFTVIAIASPVSEAASDRILTNLANKSKTAGVPQRVQIGGTCGLYALGMVMDYWHFQNPKNPTVLVSSADYSDGSPQYNFEPTSSELILDYVKSEGFTRWGEMFDASSLAKTANHFGYNANYLPHVTLDDIYKMLDHHHPVIVAFDVDSKGNPGLSEGRHAHYGVIEGYFDYAGTRYVISRHGWGKMKDYIWKADDLYASMMNLKYTEYYDSPSEVPVGLHLPSYESNPHRIDISESLRDIAIEVVPPGEQPVGELTP